MNYLLNGSLFGSYFFILILAFIITSIVHIYIIFNSNTKLYHAIKFGVFNIILKVIPILLISHTTIYFSFIIFIIYLIYIYEIMIDEYTNAKDEYRSNISKLYDNLFYVHGV